jgi:pyrimidine operon attenuation protein/uracil phosphoribosyltransferase
VSEPTVVLDRDSLRRTLVRIAHEIVEKNPPTEGDAGSPFAIVGIHRRGAVLAQRLHALSCDLVETDIPLGYVDISFYRDDLGRRAGGHGGAAPVVHATQLDFPVADKTIVIVDDVLYTGRTVRAAIDVLFDYGRPAKVQLAALVDRGHRELPIRPDFVGKNLPTAQEQRVNVRVDEVDGFDEVAIVSAARHPSPSEAGA